MSTFSSVVVCSVVVVLGLSALTACSGTAIGTAGDGGTSGTRGPSTSTGIEDPGGAGLPPKSGDERSGVAPAPGPSEYDPLFDAPTTSTTTPNAITGLWSGSTHYADVRLKLGTGTIVIATRCGNSPAVGLEVSAKVSATSIKILASKTIGGEASSCGIKVTPQDIPRCSPARDIGCFDVKGTTLSFQGVWLFSAGGAGPNEDFTKLSD